MAMGRGSSMMSVFVALLLINWSTDTTEAHTRYSHSHTHVVGDSKGWGLGVSYQDWTNGRAFAAGDTLVFKYQRGQQNVVPVNGASYSSCKASASKVVTTGNDKFKLKRGANYFICSLPGRCQAGMKLRVNAN